MRVSIIKSNGKLFESQSGGGEGHGGGGLETLLANAQAAGYDPEDVDVKYVTDEEFADIMAADLAAQPPVIPEVISDRQFFQQLAIQEVITEEEALAANGAVIPDALMTLINALPSDDRFAAKMLISGATVFQRHHPLTISLGDAYDWTSEQIDDFFIAAALL